MSHPLASIQELNFAGLHINLAKAREELSLVASEALIHVPSLPYGEYLYRLLRADLMGQEDGKVVTWRTQVPPQVVENWRGHLPEGVSIASPLVWHEMEFQVQGSPPPESDLIAWAERWLDSSDARHDASRDFQGVIHSVMPPEVQGDGFMLSVDFGSAPCEAFDELLEVLRPHGNRVTVCSPAA